MNLQASRHLFFVFLLHTVHVPLSAFTFFGQNRNSIMAESLTGEQIQALVDALPPLPPKDLGPAVQGFALAFGITSIIVVCLRIYVRAGLSDVSPRLLGLEDYLAVLSTVCRPTLTASPHGSGPLITSCSTDHIHTSYSLFRSYDTLWRRIPRCQHPITVVPHTSHPIPDLLGSLVLHLLDHN
jgi:hypothetical protein